MNDDWLDEIEPRLRNSSLYLALRTRLSEDPAADHAVALVKDIASYAVSRSKMVMSHMPEFTLHDGEHQFRVVHLMERLLGETNVTELTTPELLLLLAAAFMHDLGMAPSESDIESYFSYWNTPSGGDDDPGVAEFAQFCSARPDSLRDIARASAAGNVVTANRLRQYIVTEFIRSTHAERVRTIIAEDWDGKIRYRDSDLTLDLIEICVSHAADMATIRELDKRRICAPNAVACLPMIALTLRLADILDFDLKRTPAVLFSHLAVRNPVSLEEWQKHRSVEAWEISDSTVAFSAQCSHPAIESAIHRFCDQIDRELGAAQFVVHELNDYNRSHGRTLELSVPFQVDRKQITTKRDLSGRPLYYFRETSFELAKSQVVELLMGTKLYGNPEVALRELLQNSIDACLLRASMERDWKNAYEPSISVRFYAEEGSPVLEVDDNGVGMDQSIVDNYYSKIGSSFYTSSEFYALRARAGSDFVPTSRFGIGILSCFMVADTVAVTTRRLYGPHKSSEPLDIRIEGQESIFWISDGDREIPGTCTKLYLRPDKNPWEDLTAEDLVKAVETVVPNPAVTITIEAESEVVHHDTSGFLDVTTESLRGYSWSDHDNLREVEVRLDDPSDGLLGSVVVGILEFHGMPVSTVDLTSKTVDIDGTPYELEKHLSTSVNEVDMESTTVSIDDEGHVEVEAGSRSVAESKSRVALHGIEVATSLFPQFWRREPGQAHIRWPFPMLIVLDVCGSLDLDLNSARDRILLTDNWFRVEEDLAFSICTRVRGSVDPTYWQALVEIWSSAKSKPFLKGLEKAAAA